MHQIEPESKHITSDDYSLYPYVNNDIEYRLFGDIVQLLINPPVLKAPTPDGLF